MEWSYGFPSNYFQNKHLLIANLRDLYYKGLDVPPSIPLITWDFSSKPYMMKNLGWPYSNQIKRYAKKLQNLMQNMTLQLGNQKVCKKKSRIWRNIWPCSWEIKKYEKNTRIWCKLKQSNNRCSQLFKYGKRFCFAPLFNNQNNLIDHCFRWISHREQKVAKVKAKFMSFLKSVNISKPFWWNCHTYYWFMRLET